MDQTVFETIYRKRQRTWHHWAYMRMGKVLFIQRTLANAGVDLTAKSLFDYGFGSGTFFRYCPKDTELFGVEQDPVICREVGRMLTQLGFSSVNLQALDISHWQEHPLLQRSYDIFLCSHVLEHLSDPVGFLTAVQSCVKPGGFFLGLVPVNERAANPHHVQTVTRAVVSRWADAAGYEVISYEENDPFLYWLQPLFTVNAGWRHKLAQVASLSLGVPATLCGERLWFALGNLFAKLTRSKPTQAAFILKIRL